VVWGAGLPDAIRRFVSDSRSKNQAVALDDRPLTPTRSPQAGEGDGERPIWPSPQTTAA